MEQLESLYDHIRTFISIRAIITIIILGGIVTFYWWFRGILPVIKRLGLGLSKRNIAIFAKSDNFNSLKDLLTDSALFQPKNIFAITQEGDIGKAEQATIYLVHWDDWGAGYKQILEKKSDQCALIIYAPPRAIPPEIMSALDKHRNTIVVNFRGRLLNDIVTTMITTAYQQK